MAGTYKVVELVGTSPTSFAEATKAAIAEASKTLRHMNGSRLSRNAAGSWAERWRNSKSL